MAGTEFPYRSQRMPVMAGNIVATSQPLAAQAGLSMLAAGGNAVDAALCTAITLTVVEPTSNGIGSDAFAIVWDGSNLHGLNGSGRSPSTWTFDRFSHLPEMPSTGWDSVTVPGAVSVWVALSEKFGRLTFADLFQPAIRYAREGFPVSPITADQWKLAAVKFKDFPDFGKAFLIDGRSPAAGEVFRCPAQAETLSEIAETGGLSFYNGELARNMVECSRSQRGALQMEDLSSHRPEWVTPISIEYRGLRLHELPPNGQGLAALVAAGVLGEFDLKGFSVDSADSLHLQIEAMKIGFAVVSRHLADPGFMSCDPESFLTPEFLQPKAKQIDMTRARSWDAEIPHDRGTVYLTAADESGMIVSFIQSNYMGFGSGVVVPGTGISLQNRGAGFSLEKGHPNQVDGGKRPYHTIIPAFVTRDDKPVMSFGVMGGHMQPQGHLQMMTRIFDYGQNPQAASDAPRWCITPKGDVAVESGIDKSVLDDLSSRGHSILTDQPQSLFGGAQLIYCQGKHYLGASDHRKDGMAVGL